MSHAYGVRCPVCKGKRSRVLESREGRGYIRRRHLCLTDSCQLVENLVGPRKVLVMGVRWTTYEFFSPRRGVINVSPDTRAIRCFVELPTTV